MISRMVLPDFLVHNAERLGGNSALIMEDRVLTYAELEIAANRLAHSIIRHGVKRGDRVALWLPKSLEAIVAVWAVMKAGAAYVPVDPMAPPLRLATIARDCEIAGLVTTMARAEDLNQAFGASAPMRTVWYADSAGDVPQIANCPKLRWSELETESGEAPSFVIDDDDLASVQYTSGSTGTPKGVMVSHRALVGQAAWTCKMFELLPADRMPGYTPLSGAMSSFEIFAGARAGATTYLVPPRQAPFPASVARLWSEQRLTAWFVVPSVLTLMLKSGNLGALDFSPLRIVGFSGEKFPVERLHELMSLLPWVRFVNCYSRTESKLRTWHEVKFPPQEADTRQIGQTPAAWNMLVLDENERPVPDEAIGELWVSGPGLMSGYWGLPDLTAEVLKPIEADGERVLACRTGDLVKRLKDGGLELVGRAGQQVKIRGHRVELGEIEAVISRHPAVMQVAVAAVPDDDFGNRLRAVIVLKDGARADEHTFRGHCTAILPPHMIPETFHLTSNLPLMGNGKVDRQALLR
jgi:amino acid adenylation domain-containing protein